MNKLNIEYSVVLTSCGRFDLLRQTVESFLRFADIPPTQFIIVEDSGDEKVREVLADLDFEFDFIINRPKLGQAAAIDAGYAKVNTPFIFHCEDDWLFFRSGFIAESFMLLQKFPKGSVVLLRGRDERKQLLTLPYEKYEDILFFCTYPKLHEKFFGYSYNPGLRRLADYKRIAPIADIGGEELVSWVFKQLGFYSVHLEIPAVVHLGWGQTTLEQRPKTFFAKLQYKIKKHCHKRKERKIKRHWQVSGFPKKWTDSD